MMGPLPILALALATMLTEGGFRLIARTGFEPSEKFSFHIARQWARVVKEPNLVISGQASLLCDTTKSKGVWHEFFHSDPKAWRLKAGWIYKVRFSYRILAVGKRCHFYFIARSHTVPGYPYTLALYDRSFHWKAEPGEEGVKEFTFTLGPREDYTLILGVHLQGAIVVDNLEVWEKSPPDEPPHPPSLLSPFPGQTLTDVAFSLSWFSPEGIRPLRYEVQISRDEGFVNPISVEVDDIPADVISWFPKACPLKEGRWFWRVRGINAHGRPGEWSEVGKFTLTSERKRKPPEIEISPRRPLFLFLTKDDPKLILRRWATLPSEIRGFSGFRVGTRPATLPRFLREMSRIEPEIPCFLQVYGPNEIRKGRNYLVPLSMLEWAFQNFPFVKGAVLVEQYGAHERRRQYLAHLLPLAAKYGKLVIWAHKHGPNVHEFVVLLTEPEWFKPISQHGRYFVPVWKMNGPNSPLLAHSCCLGFWLSGVSGAWGVEPESWYWHEAGFGRESEFPPLCWGQMMLLGLSSGATCYIFEPPWQLWKGDRLTKVATEVIFPLLSDIVRHRLIPTKEEVLARVKFGYIASEADIPCSRDNTYGRLWAMFREVYGLDDQRRFLPHRLPYFFLPVFPNLCPKGKIPEGLKVFRDPKEVLQRMDLRKDGEGALCVKVGGLTVVTTASIQSQAEEPFEVKFEQDPVKWASGRLLTGQYLVFKEEREALFVHANAGGGRSLTFKVKARQPLLMCLESGRARLSSTPSERATFKIAVYNRASFVLKPVRR